MDKWRIQVWPADPEGRIYEKTLVLTDEQARKIAERLFSMHNKRKIVDFRLDRWSGDDLEMVTGVLDKMEAGKAY
jgi:hypothetical protein